MVEELLLMAVDSARQTGIRFADARIFRHHRLQHISVRNGEPEVMSYGDEPGVGIRVLGPGGWGFASSTLLTPASVRETARTAVALSRLARARKTEVPFLPESRTPREGSYETPVREDPFAVPLEEKLSLLTEAERRLHVAPAIKSAKAEFTAWQEDKEYLSSEGASYHSLITHVGSGLTANAISGGEAQRRSYPNSFGGDFAQAGFEFVRSLDLLEHAAECGREAVRVLKAPQAPEGTMNLVLGSSQVGLQVHESVGHATELDRILAYEAGFAGTSFVDAASRGKLRYGSPEMNIVADATIPGALGTFGWDDEGTPAKRVPLVTKGLLSGFLSSRETAARQGLTESGGTMRADGPLRMPLIRMTNINLLPGDHSFEELVEEARDGLYMETNVSWSIDDKRLNFQFGCEVGYTIKDGELGELVRNPLYSGMTPAFWGSLAATGDESTYHIWGLPNCGKGQPTQTMHVAHGAPAALFTGVRVRGAR
jgi:TldD protein